MEEIKVIDVILPEPTKVTSTRNQFNFPEGVTLDYAPSLSASDYKIIYNNIEYPLTSISDGDTKIIYGCKEEGNTNNTFQLEYVKATGEAILYLRQAYVDIVIGAQFKIICNISNEGEKMIIRFNKDNALSINYNLETGSINTKLFREEVENPEEKQYKIIIRFTNDKAILVSFNNKTTRTIVKEIE